MTPEKKAKIEELARIEFEASRRVWALGARSVPLDHEKALALHLEYAIADAELYKAKDALASAQKEVP